MSEEDSTYFNDKNKHDIVEMLVYLHRTGKVSVDITKTVPDEVKILPKPVFKTMEERAQFENKQLARTIQWKTAEMLGLQPMKVTPDERFKDLVELEKKYTGEIENKKTTRKRLVRQLWPLAMALISEKRIKPELQVPPLSDYREFEAVKKQIQVLSDRIDALSFEDDDRGTQRGSSRSGI